MITLESQQSMINRIGRELWLHVESVDRGDKMPPIMSIATHLLIVEYKAMMKDRKTLKGYQNVSCRCRR